MALVTAFKCFNLGMFISLDHVSSSTGDVMQHTQSDAPDSTALTSSRVEPRPADTEDDASARDGVEESSAYALVRKATFWCSRVYLTSKLGCCHVGKGKRQKLVSNKLIRVKLPPQQNYEADVLRVSPSFERMTKGWRARKISFCNLAVVV